MSAPREEDFDLEFIDLDDWDESKADEKPALENEQEEIVAESLQVEPVVKSSFDDDIVFVDLDDEEEASEHVQKGTELNVATEVDVNASVNENADDELQTQDNETKIDVIKEKITLILSKAKEGISIAGSKVSNLAMKNPLVHEKLSQLQETVSVNENTDLTDETGDERKKKREAETKRAYQMIAAGCSVLVLIIAVSIIGNRIKTNIENKKLEQASTDEYHLAVEEEKELSAADQVNNAYEHQSYEQKKQKEEATPTREVALNDTIIEYLDGMTLEEKVAGLFFVNMSKLAGEKSVTKAGGNVSGILAISPVGGLIFDETNMEDVGQFKELIASVKGYSKYEMFLGVAEAGGTSSPLIKKGLEEEAIADVHEIVETGGVAEAYSAGIAMGGRLRTYGLNINFSPLADVELMNGSTVAGLSYGNDADEVLRFAQNNMKGMLDRNVQSVVRYFPGLGDVRANGASSAIASNRTKDDLINVEGKIYKSLIRNGLQMVQMSCLSMPEIVGDDTPACMAPEIVTDILRNELEYDGVILTDNVSKRAITTKYKEEEIPVQAILAGCDMIVEPADFQTQFQSLYAAVKRGIISEERLDESLARIYHAKFDERFEYDEEDDDEKK